MRRTISQFIKSSPALGRRRSGFTLVELLVVVGVMLLLIVMTVSAVNFADDSQSVSAGARLVQAFFEGARDRAIQSREPRGIRLMVERDEANGRTCLSMVYVKSQLWQEGTVDMFSVNTNSGVRQTYIQPHHDTDWDALTASGAFPAAGPSNLFPWEIRFTRDAGSSYSRWYAAKEIAIGRLPNKFSYAVNRYIKKPLQLQLPFQEDSNVGEVATWSYQVQLASMVVPSTQSLVLPSNIVIDLDASKVPQAWRPQAATYAAPYSNRMDIFFAPDGSVVGDTAAEGLLHICLAERREMDLLMPLDGSTRRPAVQSQQSPIVPSESFFTPLGEEMGLRRIVSVRTSTGEISVAQVDQTDLRNNATGAAGADGIADNPYGLSHLGLEAGQ